MRSPDNLRKFLVGPDNTVLYVKPCVPGTPKNKSEEYVHPTEKQLATDLSINIFDQRPSVITQSKCNDTKSFSPLEEKNSFKIKLEKRNDCNELDQYEDKNLETIPVSSTKAYLPVNLSMKKKEDNNEPNHENDKLFFKYVHKKFRIQIEKDE